MLVPFQYSCGCLSRNPRGEDRQCKRHAWEFKVNKSRRATTSTARPLGQWNPPSAAKGTMCRVYRTCLKTKVSRFTIWSKRSKTLNRRSQQAKAMMYSYVVFAKCEYPYGFWKEAGPWNNVELHQQVHSKPLGNCQCLEWLGCFYEWLAHSMMRHQKFHGSIMSLLNKAGMIAPIRAELWLLVVIHCGNLLKPPVQHQTDK